MTSKSGLDDVHGHTSLFLAHKAVTNYSKKVKTNTDETKKKKVACYHY